MRSIRNTLVLSFALVSLLAAAAHAQSGAGLALRPWQEQARFEAEHSSYLYEDVDVNLPGSSVTLDDGVDQGRHLGQARYRATDTLSFGLSYDYLRTDFGGATDTFLDHVVDVSASAAFQIGDQGLTLVAGGGYAGNDPFQEGHAFYGMATLIYPVELDADRRLLLMLDYDGNRSIWPDVPLPAIVYEHQVSDQLLYGLGAPLSYVNYQPAERVNIHVRYLLPLTLNAEISWNPIDPLTLFAAFENDVLAYHSHDELTPGMDPDDRFFYRERRVEAGLRWALCPNTALTVAGGYAFDRELEMGWDVRDSDEVLEFSDEPYIRLGLGVTF